MSDRVSESNLGHLFRRWPMGQSLIVAANLLGYRVLAPQSGSSHDGSS